MGRGSSKAGGGGGAAVANPVAQPVAQPTVDDVKQGNILPPGGVAYSDFENMTDDQKADVVTSALNAGVPMFLEDSAMQHFAYFTGMSDKPTVVDDATLSQMSGQDIYRTVNNAYNSSLDMGYTSNDIAKQIMYGDFTMYSDSGGSAHGKAIYFANDYNDSSYYGNSNKNPHTIRAKVTGKTISESQLKTDYSNALARGDKLANACAKGGDRNLYALAKGYDVVTAANGYRMVLNRRGITVSSTVKPTKIGGTSW